MINFTKSLNLNRKTFLVLMMLFGVIVGLFTANALVQDEKECREMEDDIRSEQNFDGTVACHPPGAIDANLSQELEDRTDLKCVCRMTYHDSTRIWPIVTS